MTLPPNPYVAGNPVGDSPAFVGRVDVLRWPQGKVNPSTSGRSGRVVGRIANQGQSTAVVGGTRSGKCESKL